MRAAENPNDIVSVAEGELDPEHLVPDQSAGAELKNELVLPFIGLLLFTFGYYNRPEDWFPGGRFLPFALVGGILAIGGFFVHLLAGGELRRKREVRLLGMLLLWFILTIPFAEWKGGAFQIVKDNVMKILLLTMVIMNVINSMKRMKLILMLQVLSIAVMAWVAHSHLDATGRATGTDSAFGNSNDIAVILSITVPLMFFFAMNTQSFIKRAFYSAIILLMLYTLLFTYSRTGFLAILAAICVCAWHYGVKRGHTGRVAIVGALILTAFFIFAPKDYGTLIESIFNPNIEEAGSVRQDAGGSRQAREELVGKGLQMTFQKPIFGVGPNGFERLSGSWHVAHNTYLQFSAEAGIPALIMFLLLARYTFQNLKSAQTRAVPGSDIWMLAVAMRASFWAFLVGAAFTNFAYTFFPYFIIAFAAALDQISIYHAANLPVELDGLLQDAIPAD